MHQHTHLTAPDTRGRTIHWARWYDLVATLLTAGQIQRMRRLALDLAPVTPGTTVLDIGCGTGHLCQAAQRRTGATGTVVGVDAAPEMIAVAQHKARTAGLPVEYRVAAVEQLPFPSTTFDIVLSTFMLHHLPLDVKQQGFTEVQRVLKPGGCFIALDLRRPTTRWGRVTMTVLLHGALEHDLQAVGPLLAAAGFSDIHTGATRFPLLGFVRGRIPSTGAAAHP